ncbi:MAG: hypothetical protein MAG551_01523 [Candidatus Scalindua arabica]|uniref:Uncharacterized protein n=1 Tax=Candidatus Scalindua arabica TaxID=1127984 RepID=A0A942A485_9BACT|nr:hypothetical protein [Candidatus Scalindua arabica]
MVINIKRLFVATLCALFFVGFTVIPAVTADVNPFATSDSDTYITTVAEEGKCGGEGKCGEEKKAEGKCSGEGKCGGEKKAEGKCGGEGKCGS